MPAESWQIYLQKQDISLLLDENYAVPHCVEEFRPTFGALYWPSTSRQLYFANFDRSVLDFS